MRRLPLQPKLRKLTREFRSISGSNRPQTLEIATTEIDFSIDAVIINLFALRVKIYRVAPGEASSKYGTAIYFWANISAQIVVDTHTRRNICRSNANNSVTESEQSLRLTERKEAMNEYPISHRNASKTATIRNPEKRIKANRVVMALGDAPQKSLIESLFRSRGYSVLCVSSPAQARRFACMKRTAVTFLADEFADNETGWLTCRKLLFDQPNHPVVIVGTKPMAQGERLATFVGAVAYIPSGACEATIAKTVSSFHPPSLRHTTGGQE